MQKVGFSRCIISLSNTFLTNFDAESNRAVFCSITLLVGAISVMSAVSMVIIFLIFLGCSCFSSWLGVLAYRGTTKAVVSYYVVGITVYKRSDAGFQND